MSHDPDPVRVIVTGSRTWRDVDKVREVLLMLSPDVVLVHGDCPRGADAIARRVWTRDLGRFQERHPAPWDAFGKRAGVVRNEEMARRGASLCIAFRAPGKSNGTDHMIWCAQACGIPVIVVYE